MKVGIIKDKNVCDELGVKVINLDDNLCVGFIPLKTKTEEILFKALEAQG